MGYPRSMRLAALSCLLLAGAQEPPGLRHRAPEGFVLEKVADAAFPMFAELAIRNDAMREMRRSTVSVMPEGLERALGPGEFRDLLAYLLSLR